MKKNPRNPFLLVIVGIFTGLVLSAIVRNILKWYGVEFEWWQHLGLGVLLVLIIAIPVCFIQKAIKKKQDPID